MKIIRSRPLTIPEAGELLEERKKEMELEYEQTLAAEHAEKFSHSKPSDASKLVKEFVENGLDQDTAVKIVDVSPKHQETLRAILAKNKTEMSEEEMGSVMKKLQ